MIFAHWPGVIGIDLQGEAPSAVTSFNRNETTLVTGSAGLHSTSLPLPFMCTKVHGPPTLWLPSSPYYHFFCGF